MEDLKKFFTVKKEIYKEICKNGFLIFIEKKEDCFTLSTTVFSEKEYLPFSVKKCVTKISSKKKKKYFSSLKIDEKYFSVQFFQKVPLNLNISYNTILKMYIFSAKSWALVLKRIAEQDLLSI